MVEAVKDLFDAFPGSGVTEVGCEKDLYKPFAQLANKIMEHYSSSKKVKFNSLWEADADRPPETVDETASFIRPDVVSVLVGAEDSSQSESNLVCVILSPGWARFLTLLV